ncbi:dephospho-CoA kinase [Massilia sp. DWR3-1-1]|uniref:dephospho-CoA kinase n=1 Tax=Massilia sp. DWR3-1-1 TaxID=2804559 RepID=UPI003CF2C22B
MSHGKLQIGLTGGIGCGKTTVANLFAERGASVIDADLIAHAMTAPHGPAMAAIGAAFGPAFIGADGALDRAAMRALVFADPPARQRLEAILHPMIRAAAEAQAAAATGLYVIFVVPLLIESGAWRERVARILAIDCAESTQVARVMARNGLSEAQVRAIMASQVSRTTRLAAADDIIDNDDGIDALLPQVDALHARYRTISATM